MTESHCIHCGRIHGADSNAERWECHVIQCQRDVANDGQTRVLWAMDTGAIRSASGGYTRTSGETFEDYSSAKGFTEWGRCYLQPSGNTSWVYNDI